MTSLKLKEMIFFKYVWNIFEIFIGSTKTLHIFLEEINKIHTNIKFTMTHTTNIFEPEATRCSCPPQDSIQFLDTSCKIKEGQIVVDLYRKPNDKGRSPSSTWEERRFRIAPKLHIPLPWGRFLVHPAAWKSWANVQKSQQQRKVPELHVRRT